MKKSISGIRGVFGGDLTLGHIIGFANGFSGLVRSGRCVLATDTRPSGRIIGEVAASALLQNGVDVRSLGTAPTPVAFRESRRHGAAMVVTSSHNPLEWNGLKLAIDGRGIGEAELGAVLAGDGAAAGGVGAVGEQIHAESGYVSEALEQIGGIQGRPTVVVDSGGGAAAGTAPALLRGLGCNVRTINGSAAGSSRGPDPTADPLEDLARASSGCDAGFAFDLDGDRLVVVAADGGRQAPDVTLGLGVAKSMEMGHKKFVFSTDTSVAVERLVRDGGGRVYRSKVGEANVVKAILETGAHAGGEGSSGGFILPEFNYCRDGILTSGLIASMLHDGRLYGETLDLMRDYHLVRDKVRVESSLHGAVMGELAVRMRAGFSETATCDGIKGIIDEDSWVLVRESNTEDVIRISSESNGAERAESIMRDAKKTVGECHDKARRAAHNPDPAEGDGRA